jgi:hypothetical protein
MAIVNGYCTLAEVKAALRLTDNVDDTCWRTLLSLRHAALTVTQAGSFTRLIKPLSRCIRTANICCFSLLMFLLLR